jgi:tetratricopeptide (TPR) repeat protein
MKRALAGGELEEAEQILGHLRREDPLSQETRGFELEFYLNSNRLAEAHALGCQLCRLFPGSARIFFLSGKAAYRLKRYEEAETFLRESLRIYPHWRTEQWLGKTLTQTGRFEEAESLLVSVREQSGAALIDLAWLYERRNDPEAALQAYEDYLALHPGNEFAEQQRIRIKARMLDPESLIEEVGALSDLGEDIPPALFPGYVESLFETGQTPRAREEVLARMQNLDAKMGSQVAWICYRARAYDLACTLFISHLRANHSYFKGLNALESAAAKCGRLPQVLEAYRSLLSEAPHLHGRCRSIARRIGNVR